MVETLPIITYIYNHRSRYDIPLQAASLSIEPENYLFP